VSSTTNLTIAVYESGRNVRLLPIRPSFRQLSLGRRSPGETFHSACGPLRRTRARRPTPFSCTRESLLRAEWRVGDKRFNAWCVPATCGWYPGRSSYIFVPWTPRSVLLSIGASQLDWSYLAAHARRRIELAPVFNVEDVNWSICCAHSSGRCSKTARAADLLMGELLVNAACIRLAKRYAGFQLNTFRAAAACRRRD